jgi:hypothetical protein
MSANAGPYGSQDGSQHSASPRINLGGPAAVQTVCCSRYSRTTCGCTTDTDTSSPCRTSGSRSPLRRSEDEITHDRERDGVEPVLHGDARYGGVGHGLGNHECPHGDAGEHVGCDPLGLIGREPSGDREHSRDPAHGGGAHSCLSRNAPSRARTWACGRLEPRTARGSPSPCRSATSASSRSVGSGQDLAMVWSR